MTILILKNLFCLNNVFSLINKLEKYSTTRKYLFNKEIFKFDRLN